MKKFLILPFLIISLVSYSQQKVQTPKVNISSTSEPKEYYETYTKQMEVLSKVINKTATGYSISENSNGITLTISYFENNQTKEISFKATNKQLPNGGTYGTVDSICKRIHPLFLRNNY